jgi:phosphohistidine phosphatase SixA
MRRTVVDETRPRTPKVKILITTFVTKTFQSWFNVTANRSLEKADLTPEGLEAADALGKEWSNVRIDHIYASSLERAVQTAEKISEHNIDHPKVEQNDELKEQRWGTVVEEYYKEGKTDEARTFLFSRPYSRSYRPPGGGESSEDLCARSHAFVENDVLGRFGVCLTELPKVTSRFYSLPPETLPDGIPHVLAVSHNTLMNELYEELMYWNKPHENTYFSWGTATW